MAGALYPIVRSMPTRIPWSRDELLVAFSVYCKTVFGRLDKGNPEIIQVAEALGRTSSALALKTVNFASLDPVHRARGVSGMSNASAADRELWAEFEQNSEAIAAEAGAAWERLIGPLDSPVPRREGRALIAAPEVNIPAPSGPTEVERTVRIRRVQHFFRAAVLTNYGNRCALTGLAIPDLLIASHIIPWSESVERRADPRNGIALNAICDRAFDRGLITFDETLRVVISSRLRSFEPGSWHERVVSGIEDRTLTVADRFQPDPEALAWHRRTVFAR